MKKQEKTVSYRKKTLLYICSVLSCIILFTNHVNAIPEVLPATNSTIDQQTNTIRGTITDEKGEPIIGASIVEKGTTNGIISDIDGNFSITVPRNATLSISYIGYEPIEVHVTNQKTLNIVLREDVKALDEVVVVGYGTMKKSDLTGAVSRVTLDDKSSLPNMSLAQALSGTMAGVNLSSKGMAGGGSNLSIRGQTTLSASKTPLIVLDGIIYNGELNDINVSDIEYIDVLKDASAAAVYGSRSANGVIIISTKKGKSEKPRIAFNAYYGTQFETNHPVKYMNADQYAVRLTDYYYQQSLYAWYATNPTSSAGKPVRPDVTNREVVASTLRTQEERDNYLAMGNGYNEIDWFDVVMRDNPIIQNYDLSYSGSTDKVNYYFSGSYTGEEGILVNDQWDRFTFNTKIDGKVTDWMSVGFNVNYSYQDYSGLEPELVDARYASPLANNDLSSPDDYVTYLTGENYMPHPLWRTKTTNEDIRNSLFFVANTKINIPFIKGLSYDFNYSNTYWNRKNNSFYPASTKEGITNNGKAEKIPEEKRSWIFNNIITYLRTFGDHSVNATLLYSREKYMGEKYRFTSENFDNDALGFHNMAFGTKLSTGDNQKWQETGVSYMGRANYTYKNRYMATATVRRDGFSGFGVNSKYVTLPSFSLGWVTSEEQFMEKLNWLYLKLRLSYGQNGNQGAGRYTSLAKMSNDNYVYNGSTGVAIYPNYNELGNSSLAWEKTSSFNLGIDFGLLDNRRISGSIDMYTSKTTDVLVTRKLPYSSGYEQGWTNIGGVNTKGIDLELRSNNIITKDINWTSAFTFSLSRDEISKLYGNGGDSDIGNSWFVGESIQAIYNYNIIGLWREEDLYNGTIYKGWYPGQWKYEDLNGDGVIDPDNDRKVLGTKAENFRFSFSNTFAYKNWSLYFLLNSVQGGNGYYILNNATYLNVAERSDDVYRINQPAIRQYWTPDNGVTNATGIYNSQPQSGGIYQDRSFVRLQDISLMYKFSPKILKALGGFEYLQLYVSAKNLYTWTNYQGWDPELADDDSDNDPLKNKKHIPNTRNVVFGIKLAF
ncbi:MAG: TonB-dependent receptor [Tannerella sp.]|jgi:TonB-linked SusC/RagA family outer membrane protein|nr:TonB-dependent receptor [Tannerella sp.]